MKSRKIKLVVTSLIVFFSVVGGVIDCKTVKTNQDEKIAVSKMNMLKNEITNEKIKTNVQEENKETKETEETTEEEKKIEQEDNSNIEITEKNEENKNENKNETKTISENKPINNVNQKVDNKKTQSNNSSVVKTEKKINTSTNTNIKTNTNNNTPSVKKETKQEKNNNVSNNKPNPTKAENKKEEIKKEEHPERAFLKYAKYNEAKTKYATNYIYNIMKKDPEFGHLGGSVTAVRRKPTDNWFSYSSDKKLNWAGMAGGNVKVYIEDVYTYDSKGINVYLYDTKAYISQD